MSITGIRPRITLFHVKSRKENGKVIFLPSSISELLEEVRKMFSNQDLNRIYNSQGGEILEIELIRDNDVLYVSTKNEPFESTKQQAQNLIVSNCTNWIKLNVGGQLFHTSRTTLLNRDQDSMLAKMFDTNSNITPSCLDDTGAYLIDRDSKYFSPLLNYLRTGKLILDKNINPKGVLEEALFYGIQSCVPILQEMTMDEVPLTRRDVINALMTTPHKYTLRFQGTNLNGADLSYLDLRNVNFKYAKLKHAKLTHCNLSYCNFERADLTGVDMSYALLGGVRMGNAILENANCANCNFQDPGGINAIMEGACLKNAILEDSDLTGANLLVANLKNANLKSTILRGAILAGADLENSDLTGSDLHEANLRGANLKDASLELIINPLHMAQAIR